MSLTTNTYAKLNIRNPDDVEVENSSQSNVRNPEKKLESVQTIQRRGAGPISTDSNKLPNRCASYGSRKMLKKEYLLAKIGVDTAENGPKVDV